MARKSQRVVRKTTQKLKAGDVLHGSEVRIMSTPKDSWFAPQDRLEVIVWFQGSPEPTVRYWPKFHMWNVKDES